VTIVIVGRKIQGQNKHKN